MGGSASWSDQGGHCSTAGQVAARSGRRIRGPAEGYAWCTEQIQAWKTTSDPTHSRTFRCLLPSRSVTVQYLKSVRQMQCARAGAARFRCSAPEQAQPGSVEVSVRQGGMEVALPGTADPRELASTAAKTSLLDDLEEVAVDVRAWVSA